MPSNSSITNRTSSMQARTILYILVFIGLALNYMLRVNLNIAIIDMIKFKQISEHSTNSVETECYISPKINETDTGINTNITLKTKMRFSFERLILKYLKIDYSENGFEWDEYQQGLVLGSFFWLTWLTTVPGGLLSRRYGTKIVFGLGNFLGCVICALMPIAAFLDVRLLILLRVIQGLIVGVVWPSLFDMTARWIPPNERSTFASSYMGSSVGIAVFFPIFGFVAEKSSWEWVFHICAIAGTIWFIAWQYFVFNSPADHPRIELAERNYIEKSLGNTVQHNKKLSTPWKSILTSIPVWAIFISFFGLGWFLATLMTQAPTYFKLIHGWDIGMIGLLSGLPHGTRMIFSYFFSAYCDHLLKSKKLSRTNVRKLASFVCYTLAGIATVGMAYSECNSYLAVTYFAISITLNGALSAGPLAAMIDLSPNFSSIICGIAAVIGLIPGVLSPIVVGELTLNNNTIHQWKYVYLIAGGLSIVAGILYILYSSSELQDWNNVENNRNETYNAEADENDKFIVKHVDKYQFQNDKNSENIN